MASKAAKTNKVPVQIKLADEAFFACSCGSTEFRVTEKPVHWFCRCGQIYTSKDVA